MTYNDPRRATVILALETSKKKYQAFIDVMRKGKSAQINTSALNEHGIERLINDLCAMRHFGKQFQDARDAVQNAYLK